MAVFNIRGSLEGVLDGAEYAVRTVESAEAALKVLSPYFKVEE